MRKRAFFRNQFPDRGTCGMALQLPGLIVQPLQGAELFLAPELGVLDGGSAPQWSGRKP
jgi:hypothetical protein